MERETVEKWLWDAAGANASDLHLVAGYPPMRREHGALLPLEPDQLSATSIHEALEMLCPEGKFREFERNRNLDFAFELSRPSQPGDDVVDKERPMAAVCRHQEGP